MQFQILNYKIQTVQDSFEAIAVRSTYLDMKDDDLKIAIRKLHET